MTSIEYRVQIIKILEKEADMLMQKYRTYSQLEYLWKYRQTVNIIGLIQAETIEEVEND